MLDIRTKFQENAFTDLSYRVDMISIQKRKKTTKEPNSVKKSSWSFSAHCLMMPYVCSKFCENIFHDLKVVEHRTSVLVVGLSFYLSYISQS